MHGKHSNARGKLACLNSNLMQFREILVDYDSAMATIHLFNRFLSLTLNCCKFHFDVSSHRFVRHFEFQCIRIYDCRIMFNFIYVMDTHACNAIQYRIIQFKRDLYANSHIS